MSFNHFNIIAIKVFVSYEEVNSFCKTDKSFCKILNTHTHTNKWIK